MKWYEKMADEDDAYLMAYTLRQRKTNNPQAYNLIGMQSGLGEQRVKELANGQGSPMTKMEFGSLMAVVGLYFKETDTIRLKKPIPRGEL